jgi:hypothetical protein
MERICPLGRMLAVPPPLRETCFPGRGRLTLDALDALPPLGPRASVLPRIAPPAPGLPAVPGLFAVPAPGLPAPGLVPAAVPGLVPVAPGRFAVAGRFAAGRLAAGRAGAALGAAFGAAGAVFLSAAPPATRAANKNTSKNAFFGTKLMGSEFIANSWRENSSSFNFTNGNYELQGNSLVVYRHHRISAETSGTHIACNVGVMAILISARVQVKKNPGSSGRPGAPEYTLRWAVGIGPHSLRAVLFAASAGCSPSPHSLRFTCDCEV